MLMWRVFPPRARALLCASVVLSACSGDLPSDSGNDASTAVAIAQHYVDGYYHQFPGEAYEIGYPDTPLDRFGDRSVSAMAAWQAREDAWLDTLRSLDPVVLEGTDAAVPYAFVMDRLEASVARRVCRMELWNVSPTWTGWQSMMASTLAVQPVATPEERAAALARARDMVRFLETEVANLREGQAQGIIAPQSNVDAVVRQVDALLATAPEDSPFYEPATRAADEAFAGELRIILVDEVEFGSWTRRAW